MFLKKKYKIIFKFEYNNNINSAAAVIDDDC